MSSTFSQRSAADFRPNEFFRAIAARRQRGERVLDLTESNPTTAGVPYADEVILPALSTAGALRYEAAAFGLPRAREAAAEAFRARGAAVSSSEVALTASTSEAYAFAFKLLCDPGDEVLVPRPSYPLLEHLARLEGVRVASYALHYDGAWHIDRASLRAALNPCTRAIVCVNPNNPTGSFLKRAELEFLASLGLPIVSDEVFASYAWRRDPTRVDCALGAGDTLVLALDGLSKFAGLPQLKLGWMGLSGPAALVEPALQRLELIFDTFLSAGTPVQLALPDLLRASVSTRDAILARVSRNRRALETRVGDAPVSVLHAEGGWYAVLGLPRTRSEDEWVLGFLEQGVLVQPGYFYDFASEAFAVLSLLTREADFDEGCERLLAFVARTA